MFEKTGYIAKPIAKELNKISKIILENLYLDPDTLEWVRRDKMIDLFIEKIKESRNKFKELVKEFESIEGKIEEVEKVLKKFEKKKVKTRLRRGWRRWNIP